jgi:hypothetical protein
MSIGICLQTQPINFSAELLFTVFFSIDPILPAARTMTLGSTQSLTEMSTRNLPGGKGRPASKADNLTAFCELIV